MSSPLFWLPLILLSMFIPEQFPVKAPTVLYNKRHLSVHRVILYAVTCAETFLIELELDHINKFSFSEQFSSSTTVATSNGSLRNMVLVHTCMPTTHRFTAPVARQFTRKCRHASRHVLTMWPNGCARTGFS